MLEQVATPPVVRPLVTLDNNAILAVRNDEPDAGAVRQLLAFNRDGIITLNVTQSTALERQRADAEVQMQEQRAWFVEQGIAPENIFTSSRSIGFSTADAPDIPTFRVDLELSATQRVHTILFPTIPFMWRDYCARELAHFAAQRHAPEELLRTFRRALDELDRTRYGTWTPPLPTPALDALSTLDREAVRALCERLHRKWMNAKNDALGLYAHLTTALHSPHPEHAVFVTSDKKLRTPAKLKVLRALGLPGEVLPPPQAVTYIISVTGAPLLSVEQAHSL